MLCLKIIKNILDPFRTFYDSIFAAAAGAAAASVCIRLAGGVFGGLPVFTLTVRLAVATVALWLAVGLTVSLQPLLRRTGVLMNTPGGVSHPCSAQVFIITGVLLALLLGNVHVVLPACHLGVCEVSDG